MSIIVNDKRGSNKPELITPTCRVCGAKEEHTDRYGSPTMKCVEFLRGEIARLTEENKKLKPEV